MRRMMIVVLGLVFFPGCTLIAENQRLTARNALLERAVREVRWERETLEREIVRLENELQSRVAAPTRAAAPIEQGARIVVGGVTDADLAPIQRARATDDVAELTGLFESLPRLALGAVAQGDWEYARDHAMYVDRWEAIAAGQPFFGSW